MALPENWDEDTPITLAEACKVLFRGAIKPATLKAEAERGKLVLEKIGRAYFTTPKAIREMREQCRVQEKPQGSHLEKTHQENNGSSGTGQNTFAQAALNQTLKELKSGSKNTLRKSTNRPTASILDLSQSRTR
ncbi:hypothetical protein OA90_26595 [Labrenzia sp. OB1]|nr:hypothetical protein OA90_26595 [Labrenzia sp. OB1]